MMIMFIHKNLLKTFFCFCNLLRDVKRSVETFAKVFAKPFAKGGSLLKFRNGESFLVKNVAIFRILLESFSVIERKKYQNLPK
jgi:hypothetical protein